MFDRKKKRELAAFMKADAIQAGVRSRSTENVLVRFGARMQAWAARRMAADFSSLADHDDAKARRAKSQRGPWAK